MTAVVVPLELELLEPELLDRLELEEPELLGEPELLVEPELLLLEPEPLLDPEPLLEAELLELELPLPCRTTVPVRVGLVLTGVTVSVLPDAQYEYCGPGGDEVVITLPEVVNMPFADAGSDTTPIPPV
jgi:hypothetical protein